MNIEYTCSECGKTKNDEDSRYSLSKKGEKICWECQQISNLQREQIKILDNINTSLKRFDKLQAKINRIIQEKDKNG